MKTPQGACELWTVFPGYRFYVGLLLVFVSDPQLNQNRCWGFGVTSKLQVSLSFPWTKTHPCSPLRCQKPWLATGSSTNAGIAGRSAPPEMRSLAAERGFVKRFAFLQLKDWLFVLEGYSDLTFGTRDFWGISHFSVGLCRGRTKAVQALGRQV